MHFKSKHNYRSLKITFPPAFIGDDNKSCGRTPCFELLFPSTFLLANHLLGKISIGSHQTEMRVQWSLEGILSQFCEGRSLEYIKLRKRRKGKEEDRGPEHQKKENKRREAQDSPTFQGRTIITGLLPITIGKCASMDFDTPVGQRYRLQATLTAIWKLINLLKSLSSTQKHKGIRLWTQ